MAVPRCRPGDARQQVVHIAAGTPLCEAFEERAAGIHQGDDRRGQRLANAERGDHRKCSNDVQPDLATPQTSQDFEDKCAQHGQHAKTPGQARHLAQTRSIKREPRQKARKCHQQQRRLRVIDFAVIHRNLSYCAGRYPASPRKRGPMP